VVEDLCRFINGTISPVGYHGSSYGNRSDDSHPRCVHLRPKQYLNIHAFTTGLGCRSAAYLGYACLSTLVWGLLVLSSILSHYSTFTTIDPIEGKPRFNLRSRIAADMSIFFRKLGKVIASVNAIGVVVINMFQFSSFFNRCYCNSSVIGLGMKNAYFVIEFQSGDITSMRAAWLGGVFLALGSAALFVGVLNLLINPSLPDE